MVYFHIAVFELFEGENAATENLSRQDDAHQDAETL